LEKKLFEILRDIGIELYKGLPIEHQNPEKELVFFQKFLF